jgi:circadian clock protein KaiB
MSRVEPDKIRLRLRLYVSGNAPNSERAIANAKAICVTHFASNHDLEIVDMLKYPIQAIADGVIVSPTLLRVLPLPVARVIGDLSDTTSVLSALAAT